MEPGTESAVGTGYPVQFSVDYPDRSLNRLSTAFRIFAAIPIVIVLARSRGDSWGGGWKARGRRVGRGGRSRAALLAAAADDRVPPEVPALVVRLEPRAAAVREPRRRLPRADGRPLSVDRRAAVGAASTSPIPTRRTGSIAGCRSSSGCSRSRTTSCSSSCIIARVLRRRRRLVRDPLHRAATRAACSTSSSASSAGRTGSSRYAFVLVTDEYPPFRLNP